MYLVQMCKTKFLAKEIKHWLFFSIIIGVCFGINLFWTDKKKAGSCFGIDLF